MIFVGVLVTAAVLYGVSYYVNEREKDIVNKIIVEVLEQEKTLSAIAEITDRNGADAVVEEIILDCSITNRDRFDDFLNRLGSLTNSELRETETLFDSCGRFYSSRKALMVARMEREYEFYRNLVELLTLADDEITVSQYQVGPWGSLVQLEAKRSDVFARQASIQLNIIRALLDGESVQSENIQDMLSDAQNLNEEALVINQQIDAQRQALLDL